ncbi:MAG: transposase [Bdellovibrionales bacterium]|nr:transposase [Bdellovibrionales bacterium]
MVRLVWSNDSVSTFATLELMLQEIGGVPSRMTTDNPKCFALQASKYDPLLNPAFQRFAAHYDFKIECLPPADPEKKGKMERMVPFARRLFEAYPKDFVSLENAQGYMDRKIGIANQRRHGTTTLKPLTVFIKRRKSLSNRFLLFLTKKRRLATP